MITRKQILMDAGVHELSGKRVQDDDAYLHECFRPAKTSVDLDQVLKAYPCMWHPCCDDLAAKEPNIHARLAGVPCENCIAYRKLVQEADVQIKRTLLTL